MNASFLIQPQFSKLRNFLLDKLTIEALAVMGPNVFDKVTIDTAIILARRVAKKRPNSAISIREPALPILLSRTTATLASQQRFKINADFIFDWRLTDERAKILDRVFTEFAPLTEFFEMSVGINTGSMKSAMTSPTKLDGRYHPCIAGTGLTRYGEVRTTGFIAYDPAMIKAAGAKGRSLPPKRFFDSDKVLLVRTRNTSLKRRIVATLDVEGGYHLNRLTSIIGLGEADTHTLLGYLNSTFVNYIFLTRFFNYEIKPVFLKEIPIPVASDAILKKAVSERIGYSTQLLAATLPARKSAISKLILKTEGEIDRRVYELYGLDAFEVADIEQHIASMPGA